MKKTVKRVLFGLLSLVLLFVLVIGGLLAKTFSGNMQMSTTPMLVRDTPVVLIPDGYVAAFAIPTAPDHVALVDCGNDGEAKAINAWLTENKKILDAIFITHGHPDHINGCAKLPKAPIHALQAEVPYIKGDVAFDGPLPHAMGPTHANVIVDRVLQDGETITVGATPIRVFAAPGHTKGSAVYLADGALMLGDAATGGSKGQVKLAPWLFSDDVDLDRASLVALAGKLKPDEVQAFAFAHSGPLPADLAKLAAPE